MASIVVEDGTRVTGANSYVTIAELQEYANLRGASIMDDTINGPIPTTSYSNSGGTGNRTSSITVTSDETAASGSFTNLVDGTTTADATNGVELPSNLNIGEYIQFDFGAGVLKYITNIKVYGNDVDLGDWKVEGSDDGVSFTTLNSDIRLVASTSGVEYDLSEPSSVGYRYFRLTKINANENVGSGVFLGEVEFQIAAGAEKIDQGSSTRLIFQSMDYLEQQPFKGIKVYHNQPLQWPRANVLIDGYLIDTDEIPQLLKDAQCEIAIAINAGVGPLSNLERVQKRTKVGPLEVEYADGQSFTLPRAMYNKLRKLLGGTSGGSNIAVHRG